MADLHDLNRDAQRLCSSLKALSERVDYVHVATMRGDPRFCKAEYANPDFDQASFDADWLRKGKRIPEMSEVFGHG